MERPSDTTGQESPINAEKNSVAAQLNQATSIEHEFPISERLSDVAYRAKLYYEARARREAAEKDIQKYKPISNQNPQLLDKLERRLKEMLEIERSTFVSYASKATANEEILTKLYGTRSSADRALLMDFERSSQARFDEQLKKAVAKHAQETEATLEKRYTAALEHKIASMEATLASRVEARVEAIVNKRMNKEFAEDGTVTKRLKLSASVDHTHEIEQMRQFAFGIHAKIGEIDQRLSSNPFINESFSPQVNVQKLEETIKKHDIAFRNLREYMEEQKEFMDGMCKTFSIRLGQESVGEIDETTPLYSITLPQASLQQISGFDKFNNNRLSAMQPNQIKAILMPILEESVIKQIDQLINEFNNLSQTQQKLAAYVRGTNEHTLKELECAIMELSTKITAIVSAYEPLQNEVKRISDEWTGLNPSFTKSIELVRKKFGSPSAF